MGQRIFDMENKQITIDLLIPGLPPGFAAMRPSVGWCWYPQKPTLSTNDWIGRCICLSKMHNIAPFDGDWKDSLMEAKE